MCFILMVYLFHDFIIYMGVECTQNNCERKREVIILTMDVFDLYFEIRMFTINKQSSI